MYLYISTKFSGIDKVFSIADAFLPLSKTGKKIVKAGDLLRVGDDIALCLGESLSFEELYQHVTPVRTKAEMMVPGLLTLASMQLLHWMVANYYTTYKSVVKLFVSDEREELLKCEGKSKRNVKNSTKSSNLVQDIFTLAPEGQTLIVFPDLWTMVNVIPEDIQKMSEDSLALLSSHTQRQKDIHRWSIKKGNVPVICCTYAEIFQDFANLQKIIQIDPHKWYYANQQDPRYKVGEVLAQLAALHHAELEVIGL